MGEAPGFSQGSPGSSHFFGGLREALCPQQAGLEQPMGLCTVPRLSGAPLKALLGGLVRRVEALPQLATLPSQDTVLRQPWRWWLQLLLSWVARKKAPDWGLREVGLASAVHGTTGGGGLI